MRSFTVFQDALPDDVAPLADTPPTALPTLAAIEKENLHPVTGLRAGPTAPSEAKKRKTALAAKPLPPPPKKHKELRAEPKKTRKPLSSAKPRSAGVAKSSKSLRPARKASPLPPVAEEHDAHRQLPRLSTAQVDINARCYELTVSPLADVSDAYDATRAESQESDVRAQKENSAEPHICDYFSPPVVDTPLPTHDAPSPTNSPSRLPADLSTPERKRIYTAFTFSSPSPTSARFKQAQSSPS